jgi:hypothetical protein
VPAHGLVWEGPQESKGWMTIEWGDGDVGSAVFSGKTPGSRAGFHIIPIVDVSHPHGGFVCYCNGIRLAITDTVEEAKRLCGWVARAEDWI